MILFIKVILNELQQKGKQYPWQRPQKCPRCDCFKVWGHGFVDAIFDGYSDPLPLKRWRCPQCNCVMRCRPAGYFSRFQSQIETIRTAICHRIETGRWDLNGISRSRQGHWLRALKKRIQAIFGNTWQGGLSEAFDYLIGLGQIPVSRSI